MKLTEPQRRATETKSRETLVIAGAGSGKTRVLVSRVHHLLTQRGASPSDLLILTFTRKAAGELVARLKEQLGDGADLRGMMVGTFHSIAFQILRGDGAKLGYDPKQLTVCTPDDADLLLMQMCSERDLVSGSVKNGKDTLRWKQGLSWKKVKAYLEHRYTNSHVPDWLNEPGKTDGTNNVLSELVLTYWHRLYQMNVLDFGSILRECHRLLDEHPDVLARWRNRIKHVLVDELQDEDAVQYRLHRYFSETATFLGVGDRRQPIYGFRGADPNLMSTQHPNAEVIQLRECFRCGDQIVKAANGLIAHNEDPMCEAMIGATGREGKVSTMAGRSDDILCYVENVLRDEYDWSGIAILARNHKTLRRLEEICNERRIPCHRVGAVFDVCSTDEFKLIHAALRLCVNPRDDLAFLRLKTVLGLSDAAYSDCRGKAIADGTSHFVAYMDAWDGKLAPVASAIRDSTTLFNTLHNLVCAIGDDAPFPGDVSDQYYGAQFFWWFNFTGGTEIAEALRWFALRDSQDDLAEGDKLTLMTVHAAKGLEWPVVIVANCNDGDFPSAQSLRTPKLRKGQKLEDPARRLERITEERRVFYVACTRAIKRLVYHWRRREDQWQGDETHKPKWKPPSRFLAESGILIEE
jgi:DNA helicase-2/ATP-dependent DNA helicase PcrA